MVDMDDTITNLQKGRRLAAEVQSSAPGRRAWVVLLAFKQRHLGERARDLEARPWNYRVRLVEIETEYLLEGLEVPGRTIHQINDITIVDNIAQLESLLIEWVGGPSQLTYPRQCGLPLI